MDKQIKENRSQQFTTYRRITVALNTQKEGSEGLEETSLLGNSDGGGPRMSTCTSCKTDVKSETVTSDPVSLYNNS